MSHILRIESTWDDGHKKSSWFYIQPGPAREAHSALARRWKKARAHFTRDQATLTLTRHYDHPEIGGYTDVITHEPMGDEGDES